MDISDIIKLRYPLPIARAYARVRSDHDPVARLLNCLGLVEIIARYVALIGAGAYLSSHEKSADAAIDKALRALRAPSLGVWSSLARQMASWMRTAKPDQWAIDWSERRADLTAINVLLGALADREVNKSSVAQFLERVPAFRNDVAHLRRDPSRSARFADLLVAATEEMLKVTTPLVDLALVFVERIDYLGPDRLRLNLLRLQGSGTAEASKVFAHPSSGLMPGRMYLMAGEQADLVELFPFFHYDPGRDVVYLLEGIDENRPRFSAPHEGDRGELYIADELKEGLEERAAWLMHMDPTSPPARSFGAAFNTIFEVAVADDVLTSDEMAILRTTLVSLGGATDETDATEKIEQLLAEFPRQIRRQDSQDATKPIVAKTEVKAAKETKVLSTSEREDVLALVEVEGQMTCESDFPPLGTGVRYLKHQNQAFAYLTRMHRMAESHMKATRFSQRAIQAQPDYWKEVVRVARDPHISYRRLTSLTSKSALDSIRDQVQELADARSFYLALTGEVVDFEVVVRDGEECLICFHKDDLILYSALGFDAKTPGGGALTFRTYETMFDQMWHRALTFIDFERDVAGDPEKVKATLERIEKTYQRIMEARRLLAPDPGSNN